MNNTSDSHLLMIGLSNCPTLSGTAPVFFQIGSAEVIDELERDVLHECPKLLVVLVAYILEKNVGGLVGILFVWADPAFLI
jgi:hypothetical protein